MTEMQMSDTRPTFSVDKSSNWIDSSQKLVPIVQIISICTHFYVSVIDVAGHSTFNWHVLAMHNANLLFELSEQFVLEKRSHGMQCVRHATLA